MSKISSQPPGLPTGPRRALKPELPQAPAVQDRPGRDVRESDDASLKPGAITLGEMMAITEEVREQLHGKGPSEGSPYESADSQREDKLRNEETREQSERAKDGVGEKAGAKQDAQKQPRGPHGTAAKQQGAAKQLQQHAVMRGSDGFEGLPRPAERSTLSRLKLEAPRALDRPTPAAKPSGRTPTDAIGALNQAQEPGVYFREQHEEGQRGDEDEDPELEAAVEECIRLLFGVRGIHRIGPGTNDAGEPVIIVSVSRGFSQTSMGAIPEKVHRFKTLVALPYDLLPLRREL